jgi:large subunit ribosomal protein L24e
MKIETCSFSGFKIYPGHGSQFVRGDSKTFKFVSRKNRSLFLQRKKAAKFDWTIVFRRLHKKGSAEEYAKKKKTKAVKVTRSVVGLTLEQMKLKREMNPAARAAERKKVIDTIKEQKKQKQEKKKIEKAKQPKQKLNKQSAKGFAPKAAATSR